MSNCVILLTGCVNPNGMPLTTLTDTNVRAQQYYDAIKFYLAHTNIPIVFAENSNTQLDIPESERFEMLCFDGNKDKTHGKGYGECEIIEFALNHSHFITKESIIIKITGRLIIKNIKHIVMQTKFMKKKVLCNMHSNLLFADSRIFSCPYSFLAHFVSYKNQIDDFQNVYFETILAKTLHEYKKFFPFLIEPQIQGYSGSTGEIYSIKKRKINYKIKYLRYQLFLLRKFNSEIK